MKTEADEINGSNGGLIVALGAVAVGMALFVPLPGSDMPLGPFQWIRENVGPLIALALAAAAFWALRLRFGGRTARESRQIRSGVLLLLAQAMILRTAVELGQQGAAGAWTWWPAAAWIWVPWFVSTGLAVMLLGSRIGMLMILSSILLLYLRAEPGPLPLVGCLVSSLLGLLLLRRSSRGRVLRAGAGTGLLLGALAGVHELLSGSPIELVAVASVVPVVIGFASGFVVLASLPVAEWLLGEMSDVTLVEYGSDHSLLDRLKAEAPGTWHHSLNVADLAEKAAAAIGARALFCRTAALYHDIGKLKEPGIFAENINGPSPHQDMDPRQSAQKIIEHVTFGLELARKHRLPAPFRKIIAEHHGISVVRFFYAKACAQLQEGDDPEQIRACFRYPGPPPSSRESGIIALADAVEAASRSLPARSEKEARDFVRKLISDRVAEGELAECPLTLAELAQAEETFVRWVKTRHHERPAYPKLSPAAADEQAEWAKQPGAPQVA